MLSLLFSNHGTLRISTLLSNGIFPTCDSNKEYLSSTEGGSIEISRSNLKSVSNSIFLHHVDTTFPAGEVQGQWNLAD